MQTALASAFPPGTLLACLGVPSAGVVFSLSHAGKTLYFL
jgi:hypothetical protein